MLLAVHARIRRDLDYVRDLAAEVAGGLEPEQVNERLTTLKDGSILWRLQIDCLRYCGFVHSHHNAEDSLFFPELRATNPEINPVVDKLEADHRRVSDDLDAVEAAARLLLEDDARPDPTGGRRRPRRPRAEPDRSPRLRGAQRRGDVLRLTDSFG